MRPTLNRTLIWRGPHRLEDIGHPPEFVDGCHAGQLVELPAHDAAHQAALRHEPGTTREQQDRVRVHPRGVARRIGACPPDVRPHARHLPQLVQRCEHAFSEVGAVLECPWPVSAGNRSVTAALQCNTQRARVQWGNLLCVFGCRWALFPSATASNAPALVLGRLNQQVALATCIPRRWLIARSTTAAPVERFDGLGVGRLGMSRKCRSQRD